jgi:hypothetical protein
MSFLGKAFLGLVLLLICLAANSLDLRADLSGSSRIDLAMNPIPCTLVDEIDLQTPCEKTLLKFDIESIINATITTSGLQLNFDSAMGIAGLEHLILTATATIGSIDIKSELWLAAPFESVIDVNNQPNVVLIPPGKMIFVKKRVTTVIPLGGLTIKNLAMFEDVTFPSPSADYGTTDCDGDGHVEGTCVMGIETNPATRYQTQSFAFGDLLSLQGQTPSGVSISGEIGICATEDGNQVKKHSASGSVNPDCATHPKPDILFDFMSLTIGGIPLAQQVMATASVSCIKVSKCSLQTAISISGGASPIPFSLSFAFSDLFALSFGGINLSVNLGAVNLNLFISNTLAFTGFSLSYAHSLQTGDINITSSGTLNFKVGTGLTGAKINVSVARGTFSSNHTLTLIQDPITGGLTFGSLSISMGINMDPFRTTILVIFGQMGLTQAGFTFGLVF